MTPQTIRAAGYIRVSSKDQVDNESLSTQRNNIKQYAKDHNFKLTEVYADEGISGGSVKERHALLKCLEDGKNGKFNVLIIHRLSRFGRNARELLDNHEALNQTGIELRSISEGIDFGTKYGKAVLGMLAIVAELEREIIKETMLENRITRAKRGIPTSGDLPYARSFNRETNQWLLDEHKAKAIQWAANEYLQNRSIRDITEDLKVKFNIKMNYVSLYKILSERCGDAWTVQFKNQDPITYTIPRILSDDVIQKIKDRMKFNRTYNRTDITNEYLLGGFIRCEKCGRTLGGQTQRHRGKYTYRYYNHPWHKEVKCHAFNYIPLEEIENAVFTTIFENIADITSFEKAISESLPDKNMRDNLLRSIQSGEKELKRINKELEKLVDLALSGTLTKQTIYNKEQELLKVKDSLTDSLQEEKEQLQLLPAEQDVMKDAQRIRRELLEKYHSQEHINKMTFEDKRTLLHWLFDGKDKKGTPYGIYVNKRGKRKDVTIDYFLYGRITGLRTLKGNDINYIKEDDNYKTNLSAKMRYNRFYKLQFKVHQRLAG